MKKDKILKRIKGAYGLRVAATSIFIMGAFLMGEHLYLWGINDTFGHEHIGILIMMLGITIGYLSNKIGE